MWLVFRYYVVILTPVYMRALKRPHILWSIGRSWGRNKTRPILDLVFLKFKLTMGLNRSLSQILLKLTKYGNKMLQLSQKLIHSILNEF